MATIMHVSAIAEVGGIHRARQKCKCGQQSIPATPQQLHAQIIFLLNSFVKCNPLHIHKKIFRQINLCNVMGAPMCN